MARLYAMAFAPIIGGLLVAGLLWLIRSKLGREPRPSTSGGRVAAVLAGGVVLVIIVVLRLWAFAPILFGLRFQPDLLQWQMSARFGLPLVAGVLGLAILSLNRSGRRRRGVADVVRRTTWSLLPRGEAGALVGLVGITVLTAVAAGVVSQPNTEGQYRQYRVDAGVVQTATDSFYGWYYSIPALALVVALTALVAAHAIRAARTAPPDGWTREQDLVARRRRIRQALLLATGAILAHLGVVFDNLAGAASIAGSRSAGGAGEFVYESSFAALEPALSVLAVCAVGAGVAALASVVLSAVPVPGRGKRSAGHESSERNPAAGTGTP